MKPVQLGRSLLGTLAVLGVAACSGSTAPTSTRIAASGGPDSTVPVTAAPATTTTTAVTALPVAPTAPPATVKPTPTTRPRPRAVMNTNFGPFLRAEGVTLYYPTQFVERVGLHESSKAGARILGLLPTVGDWLDLPSRKRGTSARTSADILSAPAGAVRAPVSGRVLRAETYTLYCKYADSFLVIEPDARPGWEVKLLHITGLVVAEGQRVEAGVTPVAAHPTPLPFKSQVDDWSTAPAWPHAHLEVVDPSIKNPPGVGGHGCP